MSKLKQKTYDFLKGKYFTNETALKNWQIVVFIVVLLLFMIGSAHSVDKKVIRIAEMNKELRELKAEFVDVRSVAMQLKMESTIGNKVKEKEIFPTEKPPYKIIVKTPQKK